MVKIRTPLNLLTSLVSLLGMAPLYPWIDTPAKVLFPLSLAAGLWCDRRDRYPVGSLWATLLSFAFFGVYALQFSLNNLVGPAVNILVLLLCVRLITAKSGRNYLQIFALSLFALAGSSLLSLSLMFFPAMVLMVAGVCVGLVLLSFYADDEGMRLSAAELRSLILNALILPAVSLVLMVVFFIVMPRTRHPLWNFLNPTDGAVAGFSEEVRPGAFASNAAVQQTAFRAQCPQLGPVDLYWRGTVLNTPRGNDWIRTVPEGGQDRPRGGQRVECVYWPEPRNDRFLFVLDAPMVLDGLRASRSPDLIFSSDVPLNRRMNFSAVSAAGGMLETTWTDADAYLEVDISPSERLRAEIGKIRDGAPDEQERIRRVDEFFRRQQLRYATSDLPGPAAPVEEFLFTKKRGYCEFFASAYVTVLRLSGVPARLVGGYHGGQYNELGGYYLITEDMAHVWVEALLGGRNWVRIDPTSLAANASTAGIGEGSRRLGTFRRMVDAVDYFWNQAVVTYDLGRQFELLRETGKTLRQARGALSLEGVGRLPWKPLALLGGMVAVVLYLWRRSRLTVEQRLLRDFLKAVERRHRLELPGPSATLGELALATGDSRCEAFVRMYGEALYRDRTLSPEQIRQLRDLIRKIRRD